MQDVLHVYYVLQHHRALSVIGAVVALILVLALMARRARRRRRTEDGRRELDERTEAISKLPLRRRYLRGVIRRSPGMRVPRTPGLVVFVLFILVVATPLAGMINDPLFAKYGTTTRATVVDVTPVTRASDRGSPKSVKYDVTVRFATARGQKQSAQLSTPDKVKADDRMSVRYLPKHPGDAIVAD